MVYCYRILNYVHVISILTLKILLYEGANAIKPLVTESVTYLAGLARYENITIQNVFVDVFIPASSSRERINFILHVIQFMQLLKYCPV
jgi:hypothetical protein